MCGVDVWKEEALCWLARQVYSTLREVLMPLGEGGPQTGRRLCGLNSCCFRDGRNSPEGILFHGSKAATGSVVVVTIGPSRLAALGLHGRKACL